MHENYHEKTSASVQSKSKLLLLEEIWIFMSVNSFGLVRIERICRRQNKWKLKILPGLGRKRCGKKEKMLVTSIFSFFHYVFKRLLFQGRSKTGLCCKGLKSKQKIPVALSSDFQPCFNPIPNNKNLPGPNRKHLQMTI